MNGTTVDKIRKLIHVDISRYVNEFYSLVSGCFEEQGRGLCGNDAGPATMEASKEDCAKQCYNTPGCEAWAYRTDAVPDKCWLKTSSNVKAGILVGFPSCAFKFKATILEIL